MKPVGVFLSDDDIFDEFLVVCQEAQEDAEILHDWILDSDIVAADSLIVEDVVRFVFIALIDEPERPFVLAFDFLVPGFESD